MMHRAPSSDPMFHTIKIDSDDLLASALSKIAGPSELLLLEGLPLTFKNPCSGMLDNSVPKVDSLICQGWEIEMVHQYGESLVLEYIKYREIIQGWSLLDSISYLFNEPIAWSQIKVIDELLKSVTADRNRGIVQGVENALAEEPKKRIYIKGGTLHFFRPDTLRPDFSDQDTGELREYFNRLESQGIPSAFFYPSRQNDVHAKVFAEDLGEKLRARSD